MRYRSFGNTGWNVSELSLGTAKLELDRRDQVSLLLHAFERGVTLVDLSSGGASDEATETGLGDALEAWSETVRVVTGLRCAAPEGLAVGEHVRASIEASLRRLCVEQLDVAQLVDATAADLERDELLGALLDARGRGEIGHVGAVTRSPADALTAVRHEAIDVVQVVFNLVDQRAARAVFPEAEARGVALVVRSPLLEGALTDRRRHVIPERLPMLREAADRAERWARKNGDDLPTGALRFCLAQREVSSVLTRLESRDELDTALAAAEAEPLHSHRLANADRIALDDESLLDPRRW